MEDNKLKFVVHGRKEGDKFILEELQIIYYKIWTHLMTKL